MYTTQGASVNPSRSSIAEKLAVRTRIRATAVVEKFDDAKALARLETDNEDVANWMASAITWSRVLQWGNPNPGGATFDRIIRIVRRSLGIDTRGDNIQGPGPTRSQIKLGSWSLTDKLRVTPWIFDLVVSTSSFRLSKKLTESKINAAKARMKVLELGDSESCSATLQRPRGTQELTGKLALPIVDSIIGLEEAIDQNTFVQLHGSRLMFYVTGSDGHTLLMSTTSTTLSMMKRYNTTSCAQVKTQYSMRIYSKSCRDNNSSLSISNEGTIKYAGSINHVEDTFNGFRELLYMSLRSSRRLVEFTSTLIPVYAYGSS